jgi:hypothetical protein
VNGELAQGVTEIAIDDALFGVVRTPRVQRIISVEKAAERYDELADGCRWEAARLISEELADGKSQVRLAEEIGKSQAHVSYMAKTWRYNLGYSDRPSFNEAYHSPAIRSGVQPSEPESLPLGEPEPEQDEPAGEPERAWTPPPAPPRPASHPPQPTPEQRESLDRMREMADQAERENPPVPIRELLDLQGALQRAIPKMRALKNAGQDVGADALTTRIADLWKEMEELL